MVSFWGLGSCGSRPPAGLGASEAVSSSVKRVLSGRGVVARLCEAVAARSAVFPLRFQALVDVFTSRSAPSSWQRVFFFFLSFISVPCSEHGKALVTIQQICQNRRFPGWKHGDAKRDVWASRTRCQGPWGRQPAEQGANWIVAGHSLCLSFPTCRMGPRPGSTPRGWGEERWDIRPGTWSAFREHPWLSPSSSSSALKQRSACAWGREETGAQAGWTGSAVQASARAGLERLEGETRVAGRRQEGAGDTAGFPCCL